MLRDIIFYFIFLKLRDKKNIYIYIYLINHATSSNLYQSYYLHRSRDLVSPVCGIFFFVFATLVEMYLGHCLGMNP